MDQKPFVLICDDNRAIAQSLAFTLEDAGYRVQAVDRASDCVAVARRDPPVLIIMDMLMSGMDGATASGLKKDVPEIEGVPVVLLWGISEEQVQVRAEDAAAAGYLLKPYRKNVLLECVSRRVSTPAA